MLNTTGAYWNPMTRACVDYCPGELRPNTGNICRTCAQLDAGAPFFDPVAQTCGSCQRKTYGQLCVPCYFLGVETPHWNSALGECQSCADAFTDKPIWNPNALQCVAACPEDTPEITNGTIRKCSLCNDTDAQKPFWNGKRCAACSPYTRFAPGAYGAPGSCKVDCSERTPFRHNDACVTCTAVYGNRSPLYEPNTGTCTASLPSKVERCRQVYPMNLWDPTE